MRKAPNSRETVRNCAKPCETADAMLAKPRETPAKPRETYVKRARNVREIMRNMRETYAKPCETL